MFILIFEINYKFCVFMEKFDRKHKYLASLIQRTMYFVIVMGSSEERIRHKKYIDVNCCCNLSYEFNKIIWNIKITWKYRKTKYMKLHRKTKLYSPRIMKTCNPWEFRAISFSWIFFSNCCGSSTLNVAESDFQKSQTSFIDYKWCNNPPLLRYKCVWNHTV